MSKKSMRERKRQQARHHTTKQSSPAPALETSSERIIRHAQEASVAKRRRAPRSRLELRQRIQTEAAADGTPMSNRRADEIIDDFARRTEARLKAQAAVERSLIASSDTAGALEEVAQNAGEFISIPERRDTTVAKTHLEQMQRDPVLKKGLMMVLGATEEEAAAAFPEAEGVIRSMKTADEVGKSAVQVDAERAAQAAALDEVDGIAAGWDEMIADGLRRKRGRKGYIAAGKARDWVMIDEDGDPKDPSNWTVG